MTQVTVQTIADRAVLMKFTKGVFSRYKKDKQITKEVEVAKGVKGAGNYNKKLLAECLEYDAACNAFDAAYLAYVRATSPWLDEDGMRVLRNDRIMEVSQEVGDLIAEANKRADALEMNWANIVTADVARLGPMGNFDDYPSSIRDRFYAQYVLRPIPVDNDFRTTLPQWELDKLNAQLKDAETVAVTHAVKTLLTPLQYAAQRLATFTGEVGEGGRKETLREAVLLNIQQATKEARGLNIMDDPELIAMCDEVDLVMQPHYLAPEMVKEDPAVRLTAKQKIDDIMAKMGGLYGTV